MVVHEIAGKNMREALERARAELGERAVVISHRAERDRVRLAVTSEVPRTREDLDLLRREAAAALAEVDRRPAPPITDDVERALVRSGATRRLVERVCEAVAGRAGEGHPLDLAAEELGAVFPVARAPHRAGETQVLALLGPAGVGKTTTAVKLAGRLARAGRKVALVTLDTHRVGAVEQARAAGRALGFPVSVTRDAARLARALHEGARYDVVLLDTTGRVGADADQLARLEEALLRLRVPARVEPYLVLPAVASSNALTRSLAELGGLTPAGVVVSKLDETDQPAPVLEFAVKHKLPVAFLTDGPDLRADLHRARPEVFADVLLRGRVA